MLGRSALSLCLFASFALPLRAQTKSPPAAEISSAAASPTSLLILRNGEVLCGHISREGDKFVVAGEGTQLRLGVREVDFACNSLDEAYATQRGRCVAGRIEDHLNLAEWCLRHSLTGYAARELGSAMSISPRHPRVELIDRRLEQMLSQAVPEKPAVVPAAHVEEASPEPTSAPKLVTGDDLDRLVRSLPAGTVESFTANIQPLLFNNCATAGCHSVGGQAQLNLLRPSVGRTPAQRLTQRNLHNTLAWIDFANPAESKLLAAASGPHGPAKIAVFAARDSARYRELAAWVALAASGQRSAETTTDNTSEPRDETTPSEPGLPAIEKAPASVPVLEAKLVLPPPPGEMPAGETKSSPPRATSQGDMFDPEEFNRRFGVPTKQAGGS